MSNTLNAIEELLVSKGVSTAAAALLVTVLASLVMWVKNYVVTHKEEIQRQIFSLVNQVEEEVSGLGMGQLKKSKVFSAVVKDLPAIIYLFITPKDLNFWIDQEVLHMKYMLRSLDYSAYTTQMQALSVEYHKKAVLQPARTSPEPLEPIPLVYPPEN